MSLKLTIHRGTQEIGGNCVELATALNRIVLDLGMPLVDANREPFDAGSLRGKTNSELLQSGILPRIDGLFDEAPSPDAILLSHSHFDHVGLLSYTRPEIPVFATQGTSKMMLAAALFARQNRLERNRFREINSAKTFTIGDFTITPYAVDHSAYGSVAFLIEAAGKSIVYSGDLRRHGRKPHMLQEFLKQLAKTEVDLLVVEGTHMGSSRQTGIDEFELEDRLIGHITASSGLVLGAFSPADVDRLISYWKAAQRAERTFVIDVYAAFIMHLVAGDQGLPDPVMEPAIRIFYPQHFENRPSSRKPGKILERFQSKSIKLPEILHQPRRHLMIFRPSMLDSDFAGHLPENACCIYSAWAGYLDRDDWRKVQQRLAQASGTFIHCHISGHIYLDDLRQLIESIRPKMIVPIHTFQPQQFKECFENVRLLTDGEEIEI